MRTPRTSAYPWTEVLYREQIHGPARRCRLLKDMDMQTTRVPAIPAPLRWRGQPLAAEIGGDALTITAGPRTDWFINPRTGEVKESAPALIGPVIGDFLLSARVEVAFASTFD